MAPDDDDETTTEREPAGIGAPADPVDVPEPHATSGSIDISVSSSGIPEAHEGSRSRRLRAATGRIQHAVSEGVGHLGGGIEKIGSGISKLGKRVEKLPGLTRTGAGVRDLGAGVTDLGASLTSLPKMGRTPRGRVLVRSLFVGLFLVASWITVIVVIQLRDARKPDLRPYADRVLAELRAGKYAEVWEHASPRFQEVMIKERFVVVMEDMTKSMGAFREITSINDTIVTSGAGGRIGRVDLQLQFAKGKTKGTLSFHWDEGRWKLLGISVELAANLVATETSPDKREDRIKDPIELALIKAAAKLILTNLAAGNSAQVWDQAAPVFQASVAKTEFAELEADRRRVLGPYQRYLDTTAASTNPGKGGAWLSSLVEYDEAVITTRFGFEKIAGVWTLTSYKVVLPMPRAGPSTVEPAAPNPVPLD